MREHRVGYFLGALGERVDVLQHVVRGGAKMALVHPLLLRVDVVGQHDFPAGPLEAYPREAHAGEEF